MTEYKEFNVEIINQTEKAVLISYDVSTERDREKKTLKLDQKWVPWSCVEDNDEDFKNGYHGVMYVAQWWCDKEGLK